MLVADLPRLGMYPTLWLSWQRCIIQREPRQPHEHPQITKHQRAVRLGECGKVGLPREEGGGGHRLSHRLRQRC